ncbi:MAG: hypothetical protein ACJAQZ_004843, partial [Planctomycetota bacterium]
PAGSYQIRIVGQKVDLTGPLEVAAR